MSVPGWERLGDGRRRFWHGPIDLVLEAFGPSREVAAAYERARNRAGDILETLVRELPLLRTALGPAAPDFAGPVARRMAAAAWPHRADFVTPMAAVAGAVADEVLAAMVAGGDLRRAYVNNGGDIALHLAPGERFAAGLVPRVDRAAVEGVCTVTAEMPVRGIATSGRAGRSHSLGIADAVTALARSAAAADVAATLIANAVDVDDPAVERTPAVDLDPDSDLGRRPVTTAVGPLGEAAVERALDAGVADARRRRDAGLVHGAVLVLAGRVRVVGEDLADVLPAMAGPRNAARGGDQVP